MEWVKPMLRFGDPFECDREFKCFHCKEPVKKGEKIRYEFSERHRYHVDCADQVADDQKDKPLIVSLSPETLEFLKLSMEFKGAPKPGLFADKMPLGMNTEQIKMFNALAARVDALEAKIKQVIGDV